MYMVIEVAHHLFVCPADVNASTPELIQNLDM
jgi:hypothetical protein